MKRAQPEAALQKAVVKHLGWALRQGWRIHHSPNGGKRNASEAARFKAMGTSAGFPDLIVTGGDRMLVAIELKAAGGSLTDKQDFWLDHFDACGWPVAVCRSVDEVVAALEAAGVPLRARIAA